LLFPVGFRVAALSHVCHQQEFNADDADKNNNAADELREDFPSSLSAASLFKICGICVEFFWP
jgi:hypothetical protein